MAQKIIALRTKGFWERKKGREEKRREEKVVVFSGPNAKRSGYKLRVLKVVGDDTRADRPKCVSHSACVLPNIRIQTRKSTERELNVQLQS